MIYFLTFLLGAAASWIAHRLAIGSLRKSAYHITSEAQKRALATLQSHKQLEEEMSAKGRHLAEKWDVLEKKERSLEAEERELKRQKKRRQLVKEQIIRQSNMSEADARELLKKEIEKSSFSWIRKRRQEIKESADSLSNQLIVRAMHRLDIPYIASSLKETLVLEEAMIGPLIGKNGAHIKQLEKILEVQLQLSSENHQLSFATHCDTRRAIAKRTVEKLLQESRITEERIEMCALEAKNGVEEECMAAGREAFMTLSLPPSKEPLISLLGKLKLRYSMGQSVLDHSMNVSRIMGVMADELGLRRPLARRIGLLHDIGKAASHMRGSSHALIGQELARRYGEGEEVANGIGSHHEEIEPITLEGSLCMTANRLDRSTFDKR